MRIAARILLEGDGRGVFTRWTASLSFWGGYDAATGRIIDRTHPAFGQCVAGHILAMPSGRGSGSSASVLAEAIRLGAAPAAILLGAPDPIIAIGAIVAARLYDRICPVAVCDLAALASFDEGADLRVIARDDALILNRPEA